MVGFFTVIGIAGAQVPSQSLEVNGVLQEIYQTQNVDTQTKIDCSKVTDDQFERLGDVYMGLMLQNEQRHEVMEKMMGGEGSASLRQAHINMGRSYLGCWANYSSGPIYMPMMSGFGYSMMNGWGHWGRYGGEGIIFMAIIWVLAIIGLVAIVKWLVDRRKR